MAESRLTIRVERELRHRLEAKAASSGNNVSSVVRDALEQYLVDSPGEKTCFDLANELGVIGIAKKAPKDLSTNRKYLEGFGKD